MKYCLKYNKITTSLKFADEICIGYNLDKSLVDFIQYYSNKRINICWYSSNYSKIGELKKLIAIKQTYPELNFAICYDHIEDINEELLDELQKNKLKFYIAEPCLNWETFYYLAEMGVSDINISGPLGFSLEQVKKCVYNFYPDLKLRANANLLQYENDAIAHHQVKHGFFIRPEDIPIYEKYIDIIEFTCPSTQQDILYKIYAEDQGFLGNLQQIIYGLNETVKNCGMTLAFGVKRANCHRKCLFNHCHICDSLLSISNNNSDMIEEKIINTIKNNSIEKQE